MRNVFILLCTAGLAATLACATTAPPRPEALQQAEAEIAAAVKGGAEELAPEPLGSARDKLAYAGAASAKGKPSEAIRYAEQARVDARLARALSDKARADSRLAEARRLDERIRREAAEVLQP